MKLPFFVLLIFICTSLVNAQPLANKSVRIDSVGNGWAANTVNTVVYRKNSLVTFNGIQYIGYYDQEGFLVLGKRKSGASSWDIFKTQYQGNVRDAHNSISIMVDGDGFLHVAWDHHNNALRYARGESPGSLQLSEKMEMIGLEEGQVSYPEFYKLADGSLLFFYRDGGSGKGNLVINKYDVRTQKWARLHTNLINGEGKRNAYWQAFVDDRGVIHISWVWRESPDVSSNHDMAYAKSEDGGLTWKTSKGNLYNLPITASTAEYALKIPQKSELINQTSMCADAGGNPYIVSYWRDSASSFPQYHLIYQIKGSWKSVAFNFRKTDFSLSGLGTKRIPISRPQVLVKGKGKSAALLMLFRDEERGNKPSVLVVKSIRNLKWRISDLSESPLGSWEPSYDTELWKEQKILNLFIQNTTQTDGEGLTKSPAQMVSVLEWKPAF